MCIACEMAYWMAVDDEPPPKKKAAPAAAFDCDVPAPPAPRARQAKPRKTSAKRRSSPARSKSASIDRD